MPDHIGAFAVTTGIGLKELTQHFRAAHDDYNAIMAEAIADRLAEAFAECLHKRVREEWGYGCDEAFTATELIQEKYRGIRPAPGYPACPDHTEKGTIWKLLDVEANTGMLITESFAIWPGSSVSGIYFAHPQSRFFSLGKIDRDQVTDYQRRKGFSLAEVERWLGPNLNYDQFSVDIRAGLVCKGAGSFPGRFAFRNERWKPEDDAQANEGYTHRKTYSRRMAIPPTFHLQPL